MKKTRFIFTFVFLFGMLFTVFQYIPFLEEETHAQKTELTKTLNPEDGGDGDGADEDYDSDSEALLSSFFHSSFLTFYSSQRLSFIGNEHFYSHPLDNIHTPPPKV